MSAERDMSAAEALAVLKGIREDVVRLCDRADAMLQPQCRHLLGRVDALIVQTDIEATESRATASDGR